MPFGPDNQMENKTEERIGKYAELKCTCTLESNSNGKKKKCLQSLHRLGALVCALVHMDLETAVGPPSHPVQPFQTLVTLIYSKKCIFH